jgi:hypothetical protein
MEGRNRMRIYAMTDKGRIAFGAIRQEPTKVVTNEPGYRVLNYLYEVQTGSMEDIALDTGLPRKELALRLRSYLKQGLVKLLIDL